MTFVPTTATFNVYLVGYDGRASCFLGTLQARTRRQAQQLAEEQHPKSKVTVSVFDRTVFPND